MSGDGRHWWRQSGGFGKIGATSPLVLPDYNSARNLARDLYTRLGVDAYPEAIRAGR